jgi:hypothetical protein
VVVVSVRDDNGSEVVRQLSYGAGGRAVPKRTRPLHRAGPVTKDGICDDLGVSDLCQDGRVSDPGCPDNAHVVVADDAGRGGCVAARVEGCYKVGRLYGKGAVENGTISGDIALVLIKEEEKTIFGLV